ncbi:MAG: hypothetical protein ACOCV4_03330 [Myxococcota bacterium]
MRLRRFEERWMRLLFDAILPVDADPRLSSRAGDAPVGPLVDDLFRSAPGQFLLGLRAAIWVAYGSALVFRLRTFRQLTREERAQHLERLEGSRLYFLREIPMLLKMVASLAYGALPQVQAAAGLPPAGEPAPEWARGASS